MRSPVAVNTAFAIADGVGGKAGSPRPVSGLLDFGKCTSMGGVCGIFTSGEDNVYRVAPVGRSTPANAAHLPAVLSALALYCEMQYVMITRKGRKYEST